MHHLKKACSTVVIDPIGLQEVIVPSLSQEEAAVVLEVNHLGEAEVRVEVG